jgi:ribonuclease E
MSRQRIRTGVLESSTEVCPVCGGSGHVRAVSSVALQLLRGIEDQLMKSAAHDVVVRAKPEVALYVLNNKRAHLRQLEDQFGVMITIQADSGLTGQQSFAIERGGIVRQKPATVAPRISPDSVAVEIGEEEEAGAPEEETFADDGEKAPEHEHDHAQEHGGERRGRRRRGRRGRGSGSHREHAPMQAAETEGADFSEAGEDALEPAGEASPSGHERQDESGQPRKRRRRGRRGGRRNRGDRDRTREPMPSFEAHQSGSDFEAEGMPESTPMESAPQTETPARAPEPASMPEPSSAPSSESGPKRRSTVREPAPIVSFDPGESDGYTPTPAPAREEAESKGGGEIESERPRKSGWWSRFRG